MRDRGINRMGNRVRDAKARAKKKKAFLSPVVKVFLAEREGTSRDMKNTCGRNQLRVDVDVPMGGSKTRNIWKRKANAACVM